MQSVDYSSLAVKWRVQAQDKDKGKGKADAGLMLPPEASPVLSFLEI